MTEASGPVSVVTDSTADIPTEHAAALGITVIPALVTVGDRAFPDGQGIPRVDLYRGMAAHRYLPTTAAPSLGTFEHVYSRLLASGSQAVVSIHVASRLSAIFDVATQASRSFPGRVHTLDSGQLSLGLGYQAVEAAEVAQSGAALDQVTTAAALARQRVRLIAMLDTLEFVRKSGRVSWLRASLGDVLRVKLLVRVESGLVERLALVRTLRRATDELTAMVRSWGELTRIAVLHTAAADEAKTLAGRLAELTGLDPWVVDATTVIGAHIGPGAIGIAAMLL